MDTAAAVQPTEHDVHHGVEGPERLATFRRPPDHGEPDARDQSFDEVAACGPEPDLVERDELDARRCCPLSVSVTIERRQLLAVGRACLVLGFELAPPRRCPGPDLFENFLRFNVRH
jgi:hypothetical protein